MGSGFRAIALWLEGDLEGRERLVRERISGYESLEDRTFLANVLGELGLALAERGDVAAATDVLDRARALAHPDDVADQLELDALEAYICALRGDTEQARGLLDRMEQLSAGIEMVDADGRGGLLARVRPAADRRRRRGLRHPRAPGGRRRGAWPPPLRRARTAATSPSSPEVACRARAGD